jgi:hypothetical protein
MDAWLVMLYILYGVFIGYAVRLTLNQMETPYKWTCPRCKHVTIGTNNTMALSRMKAHHIYTYHNSNS